MTLDNFRSIDLTLDFANQYLSAPEVTAVAGDASGRKLHLTITDKGVVQDLTSQTVVLYWKHNALGTSGMATFTATDPKNGVFDLFLPTELLHAGRVDANIQVVDSPSHSAVMSRALIIRVESSAYDEDAAMAANAYTSLQDILTLWQTLPKQIQDWLTKYANVQINQGGTGASTRPAAFNNLSFIGTNPITSPANDTPANWFALGSGYAYYSQDNALNNQPDRYGYLIQYNFSDWTELLQIFSVAPTGEMFYRRANGDGWRGYAGDSGGWTRLSDSRNPIPVLAADASSTGMSYTITNSTVSNSFPNGYTFKFVPNVNSSTTNATLAINGGTAYPFYKIDTYTGAFVQVSSSNTSSGFLVANNAIAITYSNGKWILNDEPIPNAAAITGIVPITNGGTGTSDGVINTIAYANSADGTDGFTTVYPNLNLLKNTRNLSSTSTTTAWNTLFNSSQIYDSGIKSLSGVSALTFSFDVYIPLNATVGDVIPIQLKGQNSQATNVGVDDFNTIIGWVPYVIKQSDLDKTIRASSPIQKDPKYQSFDTALADTSSISIRQSTNISGLVYSNIKLELGSTATPWMQSSSEVTTADYPKYVGFSNVIKPNKTSSDYKWLPMGLVSIDSATGLLKPAIIGVDYAQAHPVGSVITNSSSSSAGYTVGTWSTIGSATVGSTTIYYWKRTA